MKKAIHHLREFLLLHLLGAILLCCSLTSAEPQINDSIVLNVLVTTEKGRVALGLSREDFSISIDKRPQNVLSITHREIPASVGIVIDRSASLEHYGAKSDAAFKQKLRQGLERFVTLSHASNEYFVLTFADTVSMLQDWTNDPGAVTGKLDGIEYKGNTSLYDALDNAIRKVATGRHSKQVLIVITDGADSRSKSTFNEVRESLKRSNVILYAFGVQDPKSAGSVALGMEGIGVLEELTSYVGGRGFFTQLTSNAKAFQEIFELIAIELRIHQLVINREPSVGGKEKWHKLKVRAMRVIHRANGRSSPSEPGKDTTDTAS
jgi:VWFA-related protein